MASRSAIEKRLTSYWQLEAANIVLIPAITLLLARGEISWLTVICLFAVCLMLAIGAYYWRAKLRALRFHEALQPRVAALARWERPCLILTIAATVCAAVAWIVPGAFAGSTDRIAASIMATLAVLEYVNYFHRQLQHFDHWPDWVRLISGKGFRKSQLRCDLERFGLR